MEINYFIRFRANPIGVTCSITLGPEYPMPALRDNVEPGKAGQHLPDYLRGRSSTSVALWWAFTLSNLSGSMAASMQIYCELMRAKKADGQIIFLSLHLSLQSNSPTAPQVI
jgi:hypothetical protein